MDLDRLEAELAYAFQDRQLLRLALTHRSVGVANNERLEFLGDAALGYVVAARLYEYYPGASEQDLTLMRASLVKKASLAEVARNIDLGRHLQLGIGEKRSGVRDRDSILGDALEAVLGAVVTDSGIECAANVIVRLLGDRLTSFDGTTEKDPKTRLQEFVQGRRIELPRYSIVRTEGEDHARRFVVRCRVDALDLEATASATSRREAEMLAALDVLARIETHQA